MATATTLKDAPLGFRLTEEQQLIQETIREIAQKEFAPRAAEIDRNHRFPRENWDVLVGSDVTGLPFPEEYGGAGMDHVSYAIVVEELAKACATTSVMYSAHVSLCATPVYIFGNEEQKQRLLTPMAKGEKMGAFCLSEPGSGSDSAAATCTAVKDGNRYIVNGSKNWITNGVEADYYLVIAQTDSALKHKGLIALIVEKGAPGFTFGKLEDKLGIKGSSTCQVNFEDTPVPLENVLGQPGEGFKVAMVTLDGGRIGIASQAVGIAQGAWDHAFQYSKERVAFGKTINNFQAIRFMLAEMQTEIDAARLLTYHASLAQDRGEKFTRDAAHAKLYAAEVAMRSTVKCVQIFGGYGYVTDYPVERYMRDAKITEIYEGTSEIQRIVIASNLLRENDMNWQPPPQKPGGTGGNVPPSGGGHPPPNGGQQSSPLHAEEPKELSLYQLLQVDRDAHVTIIRYAYRFLAAMYHPDNGETGDAEKFRVITEAWKTLSDDGKRAAYDMSLGLQEQASGKKQAAPKPKVNEFGKDSLPNIPKTGLTWQETELRLAVLQIMLAARKKRPSSGGASGKMLMDCLNIDSVAEIEFALWYLREKGWIESGERVFMITASGLDYLMSELNKTTSMTASAAEKKVDKILNSGLPAVIAK